MKKDFIKFPTGEYARRTKTKFFVKYGFPNVLSCVDGTLIPIVCPTTADKEEYRSRKGRFSINVLAAAGADMEFTNIVARWKGSTHDSRVLKNSSLYSTFEERDMGGILIGDSGYACNRCLHNNNTLRFSPRRCCIVIVACAILHNFGIKKGLFEDVLEPLPEDYDMEENEDQPEVADRPDGILTRNQIIRRHFTN
ncbi:putative nuclease HARBI1 isoform X2 [Nilaparvata lugens]|uniref:putative nuclease HARBI1 isoform X2 n=1 Tax=Nilaparvata lugens TaxID=108931 RepID=UPI00193DDD56|nr:putative nuclease HARBI1 isoform X2 [Nilaparvata lugens]